MLVYQRVYHNELFFTWTHFSDLFIKLMAWQRAMAIGMKALRYGAAKKNGGPLAKNPALHGKPRSFRVLILHVTIKIEVPSGKRLLGQLGSKILILIALFQIAGF